MSSLFGSLNSQPKPAAGLFGSSNQQQATSAPATGGGLFASLNTTQAQPARTTSSGLFGSLGASQNQPQASTPTGGGGLFSGLGLSSSTTQGNQQGGGGMFGSSNAQTQQPATSSLFGQTNNQQQQQQQPATSSLFGGQTQTNQQQQQPAASSFGLTQTNQQSGLGASTAQGEQAKSTTYFDSILERSRKRNHAESTPNDLPQLQLGLGDLRQRMKKLGSEGLDRNADGRAHYLLAASGVNPGATIRDLNRFNATNSRVENTQPVETNDADVESYLANLQTQTTMSMIADGLARSVRDFDNFLEENVTMEWDAQRKRIYDHFGIKPREDVMGRGSFAKSMGESQSGGFGRSRRSKAATMASSRSNTAYGDSAFGRSGMQKSVIGAAGPIGAGNQPLFADVEKQMEVHGVAIAGPHDRFQREKEGRFSDKVRALNSARLQKRCYPVCDEFAAVVKLSGEHSAGDLIMSYRALMEIVGEDPEITSLADKDAIKERQYADAYLDESQNSAKQQALRKKILRGGARCFEKAKFEEMEECIAKHPKEANLGGIPNVINKVKAYVRLRAGSKHLCSDNDILQRVGDDYVWPVIYYLLRTGHVNEVVDYVASNSTAFRAIDRNFTNYITDYASSPDRRLRRDNQERINNEYNQRTRIAPDDSTDPFRLACYKIIGRCNLQDRSLPHRILNQVLPDFLWLQLALAREASRLDETASESYGLAEVQVFLRTVGSRFFTTKGGLSDVGGSWGAYVFYQLAMGLFEQAVAYLYTYSYVDGVHLAIALDYYGLLRVSDPSAGGEDLLSHTTRGSPQLNFGRMLGYYTRDFRAADVGAAVDYLVLICLNKDLPGQVGQQQKALCYEALRELVLESREFALLLGDIKADGQRIKGVIEERMALIGLDETDDFMRAITIQAASIADDNGRITDAVLLFHLAEEYDTVMGIITRTLSESVNTPIGQEPPRLQPLKPRSELEGHPQAMEGTLSLTSIEDPVVLARAMFNVYASNTIYSNKIKDVNSVACRTLLKMNEIKIFVEEQRFAAALDFIRQLDILPLQAQGNASTIRSYATKFSALPQVVSICVPSLLMWTIESCSRERTVLLNREYGGNDGTRMQLLEGLRQNNMDLTTYTSQLRYRFPGNVLEALARAQSE